MTDSEILEKVKTIVADQLSVDAEKVVPEASFADDLNADSLDSVELIMALEEAFNIEIPDEEAEKLKTVQDVLDFITNKAAA
ncbi:acyl carrier protein [Parathermosynechococcus lividus]|nr:acyl carrier protein [Synechococcus sp. PCC 6716]